MFSSVNSWIQWSYEYYSMEEFIKTFPLPQVVKLRGSSTASTPCQTTRQIYFDETVVFHSIRNIQIIRATDSLKHEFFLPKDTSAHVEVSWKNCKNVYDNVEELARDFPGYVLVKETDKVLGIKKGDVLKLKQTITSREGKHLQCTIQTSNLTINIPFGYKGLFKNLGDLSQEHVLLRDAVQHCKLPRFVKFVDNQLQMKKVNEVRRQPLTLSRLGEITLHEVINYSDVIACKTTTFEGDQAGVEVITIPLYSGVKVAAPTTESRDSPRYSNLCSAIGPTVSAVMASRLAIQHGDWLVFERKDNLKSSRSSSEDNVSHCSIQISLGKGESSSYYEEKAQRAPEFERRFSYQGNVTERLKSPFRTRLKRESLYSNVRHSWSSESTSRLVPEDPPPIPPRERIHPSEQRGYLMNSRRNSASSTGMTHQSARKTKSDPSFFRRPLPVMGHDRVINVERLLTLNEVDDHNGYVPMN